jgi:Bifunctional DNA primase/polymerase, N-terminal/Primase C terminal 1 (PriCT-1)
MQKLSPAQPTGKRESARNPLVEDALKYAARGWRVFPIHSPTAEGCSCEKPSCEHVGKHSRIMDWPNAATTDPAIIRDWWARWPDANIGIATGPESGIFVLDVDGEDGQASLKLLEADEPLPQTLRALTGRRGQSGERTGFHLYFNCAVGTNLNNKAGLLGKGLDIRAAGTCVVAPPSRHSSGLRYEWAQEVSAIVDAPPWLIAMASKTVSISTPTLETGSIYEGERDDRLFRLAAKWRRASATEDDLVNRLRGVNHRLCKPPLDDSQVLKIARSAACIAVGSLDPLDAAWEKAKVEGHYYAYDKLLALIRHLECQRPGFTILLPVERIGRLLDCDRTLVGRHRKKAIAEGIIQEAEKYIPHQKATRFKVLRLPNVCCPTKRCPTKPVP